MKKIKFNLVVLTKIIIIKKQKLNLKWDQIRDIKDANEQEKDNLFFNLIKLILIF